MTINRPESALLTGKPEPRAKAFHYFNIEGCCAAAAAPEGSEAGELKIYGQLFVPVEMSK